CSSDLDHHRPERIRNRWHGVVSPACRTGSARILAAADGWSGTEFHNAESCTTPNLPDLTPVANAGRDGSRLPAEIYGELSSAGKDDTGSKRLRPEPLHPPRT